MLVVLSKWFPEWHNLFSNKTQQSKILAKVAVIINTLVNEKNVSEDEQLALIVALRHLLEDFDPVPVDQLATSTKIIKLVRSVF
jgi:hypothetical protein